MTEPKSTEPPSSIRTQVGIVGAGPAGLLLAQLLHVAGIDSVVLERRSLDRVLARIRAGVLEQGTAALLERAGVAGRMEREGLVHRGVELCFNDARHRIDFAAHDDSRVVVYGQTELTRDLVHARRTAEGRSLYEVDDVCIEDVEGDEPSIHFRHDGRPIRLACDFVAGCDGFHGVSRKTIPSQSLRVFERVYPFAWLGVMADTKPVSDELIYVHHARGFALLSMRSQTRTRCYVQCDPADELGAWSDERFWDELRARLPAATADRLQTGPSIEKSIAPARSFVAEPMSHGRLFLAGDAAHIVPPTGAKGLNLAAADVGDLADALIAYYADDSATLLESYSARALRRAWNAERFSWWLTGLLHRFPRHTQFDRRMQLAELDHLIGSPAAQAAFAESYTGHRR